MEKLVQDLIKEGYLKTPHIIEAFKKVDRQDFVPEEIKHLAYLDEALPIGYGQTISQPLTVAFMLEILQPMAGEKILDIGTGSGWKAALLTACGAEVISIEVIPELHEMAKQNLTRSNLIKNVRLVLGDGSKGYPQEAPYDEIISGAAAKEIPEAWKEQLKLGGKLLAPLQSGVLVELTKKDVDNFEWQEYEGFAFVPLVPRSWQSGFFSYILNLLSAKRGFTVEKK